MKVDEKWIKKENWKYKTTLEFDVNCYNEIKKKKKKCWMSILLAVRII